MTTWKIDECHEVDCAAWDAYVHSHKRATPYHVWGWGQACQKAYGHRPYYLIARDQQTDQVQGVLPLMAFKRVFGEPRFLSLPFCDVGGVLADNDYIATDLVSEAAHRCNAPMELRTSELDVMSDEEVEKREDAVYKVRMMLALPDTSDALMSGFKSKLRSQIRKAEKNGLVAKTGRSEALLQAFYSVFQANMRDLGSPVHSFAWFEEILKAYQKDCLITVIYAGTQAVGGGLVLFGANGTVIPWASTLQKYNHLSPNMLMYWSLLSSSFVENRFFEADTRSARFDFGRSTMGEGTYRFKKQWGAKPVALKWRTVSKKGDGSLVSEPLLQVDQDRSSWKKNIAVSVWRRLPVPMATLLGSRLRGYISL